MPNKISAALGWKLLERFGVQGTSFVIQIVLARLLTPDDYGILSIMVIFTALANVFVQSGLNTALIQNKDVTDDDYSSVFWVSLSIAVAIYIGLFFAAPFIADFYSMPSIILPFRVLCIILIPGAFNSIQTAKVSREMNFKKIFTSNLISTILSGVIGIIIAMLGGGVWALVAQSFFHVFLCCIVMLINVRWFPKFVFNLKRVKILISFGWKLLASSLINTLYQDLSSLLIGKKYTKATLGLYSRGKQFPQFIINSINGAVQSVMLPAMSEKQDNKSNVKHIMRTSITLTAYIIFPIMAGLAATAPGIVKLLLTDKWLPCVPYMQLFCFNFAFYPVHSCNLQAINAMGRSGTYLKTEIIKKSYGVALLLIAVFCFNSPIAIAATGLFTTWISWFVNSYPNKKLIGYSYKEQLLDLLPPIIMSLIMFALVLLMGNINIPLIILLIIQVLAGIIIYSGMIFVLKPQPYYILMDFLTKRKSRTK